MAKITLSVRDPELFDRAKEQLKKDHSSISEFLEKVLRLLVDTPPVRKELAQLSPWVQQLAGSAPMPEGTDYKKVFRQKMEGKYGHEGT